MMKTFKWTKTRPNNPLGGEWKHTFLRVWMQDGVEHIRFWGILDEVPGGFRPVCFKKRREGYVTIEEILPLEEARLAVEKYLMDNGVIEEGDVVAYEE